MTLEKRPDQASDGDAADRERDADAQRGYDDIRFGVVPILDGVVPVIKQLNRWNDNDDRHDCDDQYSANTHLTPV